MTVSSDPISEFASLFERARKSEVGDPTACALATSDPHGRPSVRMVLLKAFDESGFVFYTNYGSRKALELEANPYAALCFYWDGIGRQVRVEGETERLPEEESDAYYASRGRQSRIGAWASKQSQPLKSRTELMGRVANFELRFAAGSIPRPPFWGGYRIRPRQIEFWSNQLHRLHDRRLFTKETRGWSMERLCP